MDTPRLPDWNRIANAARSIDLARAAGICAALGLTSAAIGSAVYFERAATSESGGSETAAANWPASRLPRPRPTEPLTTGSIHPVTAAAARTLEDEIELAALQAGEAERRLRLRDKATLIASSWAGCDQVVGAEVLENAGNRLTVRIDCANATRFNLDEEEIAQSRLAAWSPPLATALTDAEAVSACEATVRRGLPHPTSLQRSFASTGVARAPGSNPVVTFDFDALNGLGFPLSLQAQCVFAEHALARLEVNQR